MQLQGFQQFCRVADMFVKALDITYFWHRKALFERLNHKLPGGGGSGGMLTQEIFRKEHSETLFPAFLETKYQFPMQGWSSLKFSLKSKIFHENGQVVGYGGGGMATTESSVVYHFEFIFYRISKNYIT